MMQPARRDHLRLIKDQPSRWRVWPLALCVGSVLLLAWYLAGWRVQAVRDDWWAEYEAKRLQALPMVRIECVDARGRALSKELTVSLADAERIIELIELAAPTGEPALCWPRRL